MRVLGLHERVLSEMMGKTEALSDEGCKRLPLQGQLVDEGNSADARNARRLTLALALLCAAGILLASFYPFQRIHDPEQLDRQWQRFTSLWFISAPVPLRVRLSFRLGHLLENFFFYFPLGVAVALSLRHNARGRAATLLRAFTLALGFVMSLAIEFFQIDFVNREPDLTDTIMNTLGYLAGLLPMRWVVRRYGGLDSLMRWFPGVEHRKRAARMACLAYSTLLLLMVIYPLEPVMEISRVIGRMGIPSRFLFRSYPSLLEGWTLGRLAGVVMFALLFAPLGFLVRSALRHWNTLRLCICLLAVLGFAAMVQIGWCFDFARVLGGAAGALTEIGLAGWLTRYSQIRPRRA